MCDLNKDLISWIDLYGVSNLLFKRKRRYMVRRLLRQYSTQMLSSRQSLTFIIILLDPALFTMYMRDIGEDPYDWSWCSWYVVGKQ